MESEAGWGIELFKGKEGKEVYYRYLDPNFSINNKGLNESESAQMKEALLILSRFKGMPQFEWVDEVVAKFESSFGLKKGAEKIIGFDENKDYTAVKHIGKLFESIHNEKAIKVTYKNFKHKNEYEVTLHPYYLKQYNNRWFCFGLNDSNKYLTNLALDRIIKIKDLRIKFIKNEDIDFNEKSILLIDDVANSGRTMLYALKPLLQYRPKQVETLALVERTHKKFPIAVDYVGLSISTSLQEHIIVDVEDGVIAGARME